MDTLLLAASNLGTEDYTGFTFFIGTMAMMAATAFFLLERNPVPLRAQMQNPQLRFVTLTGF